MDRFKFRVWDKNNNIMVYCWSEATKEQRLLYENLYGKDETYNCWQCCQLDCLNDYGDGFIIEQCTGLKDKNGKLIYEGDIILVEDNKCPIEWEYENARYNVVGYGEIAYLNYNDIEVIGNIHENADLIKVGGK